MRPDLVLDAADLALLEIDDRRTELERRLIQEIRFYQDEHEKDRQQIIKSADAAKDARLTLGKLRLYLEDLPIEADRCADDIKEQLDRIEAYE